MSSPQDRSKRFTLYLSDRPVHSDTILASLGSIQPYANINARRLLVHIFTMVRYSFIQLSELEQRQVKKLAEVFTLQHMNLTRVLVVDSPKLYPLAIALYKICECLHCRGYRCIIEWIALILYVDYLII